MFSSEFKAFEITTDSLYTASAPALFPDPLLSSSPAIVPFSHTVKDEDREIWAASYPSGTFFVITNRSSYDHLPEYRQWQASAHTRAVSMPSLTTEGLRQAQSSVIRTAPPVLDSQSVFVPYFEETISPSPQSLSVSTQSDTSGLPNQWVQHASLYQAPAPQTSPMHSGFPALLNGHIGTQQDFGGAGAGGHSPFRFGSGQYQSDLTPFQPALSIDIPQQQQYAAHMEAIRSAPIPGQHGSSASFWPSLPPQRPFVDERPRTYTGEFIHATSAGYGGGGHSTGAYFTHSI